MTTDGKKWSPSDTIQFVNVLLYSLQLLHMHGITHGDCYGHNVLISFGDKKDEDDNTSGVSINVRLSDFGASFMYDMNAEYGTYIEKIKMRAFQVKFFKFNNFVFTHKVFHFHKQPYCLYFFYFIYIQFKL